MENNQEKSQEEMVKEAVEEAKKSAGEQPEGEPGEDQAEEECAKEASEGEEASEEKSQMYEIGAKDIIEKILPVVDNFERGLDAVKEEDKEDPFIQGMEMVYKQLMTVLGELGAKPIEAVGKEFDPNLHNAVMHVEDENFGENIIAEEFQKGYMYRDSVVRHSMVKVAN